MEKEEKNENTQGDFKSAITGRNIPVLTLDQKWYALFPPEDKPEHIAALEDEVNTLVKQQAKIVQETKELKKLKSTLMKNIMINMEAITNEKSNKKKLKAMDKDQQFIIEINQKLEDYEQELMELPRKLKEANERLMVESMEVCYDTLTNNQGDIDEIAEWIRNIRIELKKNILRKQDKELENQKIYAFMHDIFGAEVLDVFDNRFFRMKMLEEKKEEKSSE